MQTGTFDQGTAQRTHRVKPLALSLAGLLIAVVLIGGGVAGLDRHLLSNDGVRPFDGRSDGDAVVLAPAQPHNIHDRAAPPAFVPGRDSAAVASRVTARADRGTGGAAAPHERAVPVGRAAPADERAVGGRAAPADERSVIAPTTGFTASLDSDSDGPSTRTEFHVRPDLRPTDTGADGRPDGEDDTDGNGLPNGVEDDVQAVDPSPVHTASGGAGDGATGRDGDGAANDTEVVQGTDLAVPDGPAAPGPTLAAAPDAAPAPAPAPEQSPAPASR